MRLHGENTIKLKKLIPIFLFIPGLLDVEGRRPETKEALRLRHVEG
jgi:hypothetical protein